MAAADFVAYSAPADYVILNLFERFPTFLGWFQLLLQLLLQDHVVSPLESRTPGFACIPKERSNGVESGSEGAKLLGLHVQSICCQMFQQNTHG
jgi:hypothetical protein